MVCKPSRGFGLIIVPCRDVEFRVSTYAEPGRRWVRSGCGFIRGEGQSKTKGTALADDTFHPNFSAVCLNDAARNGKSQAGSADAPCGRAIDLKESVEDFGEKVRGDAFALIRHARDDVLAFHFAGDGDLSAFGIFDRILEQIV